MVRLRVCRVADVPTHRVRAVPVAGVTWPVLVLWLDGEIVATPGVCPHEDVGLADGELVGGVLTCPGHGYQFDLATGRCAHDPALLLRRYAVTVIGDDVWIDVI